MAAIGEAPTTAVASRALREALSEVVFAAASDESRPILTGVLTRFAGEVVQHRALAHSLRLEVVAEGVETAPQIRFLKEQACDMLQGFYLSQPIPATEFAHYVKHEHHTHLQIKSTGSSGTV